MRICKHDVFLSFRGPDTRNTFIDHLYHHLTKKGISVFKDDQSLRIGDSISQQLLQAIQDSRVSIVVFSTRYADSSWCLDEMAAIYECRKQFKQTVIPVFYDVDPSYIRRRFKDFSYDDGEHIRRISKSDPDRRNRWNTAMTELAGLAGFDVRFRGEFGEVEKIVQAVIETLGHEFSMLPNDQPRLELEKSPPVVTIVLKIRMHCKCDGCTHELRRKIRKIKGVESVEIDLGYDQAIVKGVIDPAKLVDEVYNNTKKQATIVKEEEKKEEEKKEEEKKEEIKEEEKKESEEEKKEEEKKEEEKKYSDRHKSHPVVTIVLKIIMNCDGCTKDLRRKIRKIKGVESVELDLENDQAIIKGVIDPAKLVDEVYKRTKKRATIVKEEEKKEEEKKEDEKKEEKKESEEEKKEEEREEGEKKEAIKEEEKKESEEEKKEEENKSIFCVLICVFCVLIVFMCFWVINEIMVF